MLLTTSSQNTSIELVAWSELGTAVVGGIPVYLIEFPNLKRAVPDNTIIRCWALILGIARPIAHDDRLVKGGGWQGRTLATQMQGHVLGLCGLGRLGMSIGRIATQAWGMLSYAGVVT